MKCSLFSAVFFLAATIVSASDLRTVPVFQEVLNLRGASVSSTGYGIEPELGRAWLDVKVEEPGSGEDSGVTQTFRAKVAGLSFDAAKREIIFQPESGEAVTCVKVVTKKRLWIRYEKQVPTGLCRIAAKVVSQKVDTGFQLERREVLEVNLEVQTGS